MRTCKFATSVVQLKHMKKGTIKKEIRNLVITSLAIVTIGSAGLHAGSEIRHRDNSPLSQTYEMQQDLGFTGNYRSVGGRRLEHNNGEPIYVSISSEFNDEQRAIIIEHLNHIFGLVGSINDNYKYEIVESVDSIKYLGKSTIKIRFEDLIPEHAGETTSYNSLLSLSSTGKFTRKCDIKISRFYNSPESAGKYEFNYDMRFFPYTVSHELFHCFGVGDIYTLDTVSFNSLINIDNQDMTIVSPNDYKLLVSLYSRSLSGCSEEEKEAYLEQSKKMIEEYTQSYYEQYCKKQRQSLLDDSHDKIDGDIDVTFNEMIFFRLDYNAKLTRMRVKTQNNKYTIALLDSEGQVLDKCSGRLRNIDGVLILENAHFINFIKDKDIYIDFYLISKNNNLKLYQVKTIANFFFSKYGYATENVDKYNITPLL